MFFYISHIQRRNMEPMRCHACPIAHAYHCILEGVQSPYVMSTLSVIITDRVNSMCNHYICDIWCIYGSGALM